MNASTSALENIIPFPTERVESRVAVRSRELETFFLGQPCHNKSVEATVRAWATSLPPTRCRGRAALAMRVKLVESRLQAMQQSEQEFVESTASTSALALRQRHVLALLGAMCRHCCPRGQCHTASATRELGTD